MKPRAKYGEFGSSVSRALTETRLTQTALANATGTSSSYLNQVMTGRKLPSAKWVELVCDVMELTPHQREELHRNAAKAHGFKLDLTKK